MIFSTNLIISWPILSMIHRIYENFEFALDIFLDHSFVFANIIIRGLKRNFVLLPVFSAFAMAAASSLPFATVSLPLSNHASVSGEARFFSSSFRRSSHPIPMNARTASLSHRSAQSLDTTEVLRPSSPHSSLRSAGWYGIRSVSNVIFKVGEDSGAPSPLDGEANADKVLDG